MDSDQPKLSVVAGENDDTTQMEDEMRRHSQDQACFLSAEKQDEILLPGFQFYPTDEELPDSSMSVTPILDEYIKLVRQMNPLVRQMNPPRVVIDNESCKNSTVIKVDSDKSGILLQKVMLILIDLNLLVTEAYICSDEGRFMDVFNMTDCDGNKITDDGVLDYIKQSLDPDPCFASSTRSSVGITTELNHTSIKLIGSERPGLLSEVCNILTNLKFNVVNAEVSTYNTRFAYVIQVTDEETGGPITDLDRIVMVKRLLYNVLKGSNKSTEANTLYTFSVRNSSGYPVAPKNRVFPYKRTYYSNTTPSNYASVFASMDNQLSESPSNQHPEVRIDIVDGNTELLTHQSWKEYRDFLKNSLSDYDAMKLMSGTIMAVSGQVIGGVMVNRITTSGGTSNSWVEIATVLGLCATLAGISLRGRRWAHSMIKIGSVITASAIIFSMGLHLPPVVALTVGPVMFLIMAAAAVFA